MKTINYSNYVQNLMIFYVKIALKLFTMLKISCYNNDVIKGRFKKNK